MHLGQVCKMHTQNIWYSGDQQTDLFLVSQIDQKGTQQPSCLKKTVIIKRRYLRSAVVFLTPGTWDAVIQISFPLAQFQMSFTTLLQEAEMVPPFLLMYATAVVLSSFNNTCSLVLVLQKAFKQKKAACNSQKFMWHLFFIQFHLAPNSVT